MTNRNKIIQDSLDTLSETEKAYVDGHRRLLAMKHYRERVGVSIIHAKEKVEAYENEKSKSSIPISISTIRKAKMITISEETLIAFKTSGIGNIPITYLLEGSTDYHEVGKAFILRVYREDAYSFVENRVVNEWSIISHLNLNRVTFNLYTSGKGYKEYHKEIQEFLDLNKGYFIEVLSDFKVYAFEHTSLVHEFQR
jgi:hypothetical protein